MDAINATREQLVRDYYPAICNLRRQPQISLWSDHHLVPQPLFDLLPFGRALSPTTFYSYCDYTLASVVEAASRNLLYWTLSGARHFNNHPAEHIHLFFDDTFFWHYYVPAKRETITQAIREGN